MMKDVRKAWEHFDGRSFCRVSFLKILVKNMDFQAPWRQFLGSLPRSCAKAKISSAFASRSAFCFFACCAICLWVYSVAVNGRVLRTPLGHDLCSCHEQSRFWHGRGIIKFLQCVLLISMIQELSQDYYMLGRRNCHQLFKFLAFSLWKLVLKSKPTVWNLKI